jgi:CRP/FNR family transcriptional regulator, anaerobic regulatory protein
MLEHWAQICSLAMTQIKLKARLSLRWVYRISSFKEHMAQLSDIEPLTLVTLCARAHIDSRSHSLCAALDADELGMLDNLSKTVSFAAQESLFLQDQDAQFVFNVTSGSVRVYRSLPDGGRQIVGFALPGDFLGLSMNERNTFSADALTPTTACKFPRQAFSDMLDDRQHVLKLLHSMTGHELSLAQEQMVIMGCHSALQKVVAFLIGLRNRWSLITGESVHIPLPMTRQDIADFLGISIETVSRSLSRLAREKAIVVVPDGVRLLNVVRLETLARH